jgi:hypothetical protein
MYGMMFKEKEKGNWPIYLVLNSKASNVLDFHTRHYSSCGLMKKISRKELTKDIGCREAALTASFTNYNSITEGKIKDLWGKLFYHNLPFNINNTFHVALTQPVLHFTMGGMEINDQAQVLNGSQKPFDGLFTCGERAGGVHGANRQGGSSLLGCAVVQSDSMPAEPIRMSNARSRTLGSAKCVAAGWARAFSGSGQQLQDTAEGDAFLDSGGP